MVDHDDIRQRHRVQASREGIHNSSIHDSSKTVPALVEEASWQSSQGQDEEAETLMRSAIGLAIIDAFHEALVSREDYAASRSIHGVPQGTTGLREAARRRLYGLWWSARRSQRNAIDRNGRSAVTVPGARQRSIMSGGRSMYELSQGAQGFQADSRTILTNGAGLHMLMPVQPAHTTILDIVN
ncbi:hypothetical protein B0A48_03521 [Cryoendolithus antarcticus]|uniref:Uncharacterized protein n=1 Tax=Cryoendolithus antarcticus TaxID=1507870 RepID=A0A1V8TKG0_9PEZI|nr:hypothetical protein B0A48_03521 [Cryoendolithus antarcticus]